MRGISAFTLAACLVAWAVPVVAQQSVDYASVSGRVTDPSGGVIPGAEVTARHTDTNVTASAPTDEDGRFRFPYLSIGPYVITVRQQGFRETTRSLTLVAGAACELPVSLTLGGVDTNVTVTGRTELLEAARSQIAGTVS